MDFSRGQGMEQGSIADGIIGLHNGVGVTNGTSIGSVQIRDIFGSGLDLTDTAQLVFGFLVCNPVDDITSLNIIDQTEVFSGLFNLDNIHESSRESSISTYFAINFDQSLFHDSTNFLSGQGVLQTVSQEN